MTGAEGRNRAEDVRDLARRELAHQWGRADVEVSEPRRLTGGASRETWELDAVLAGDVGLPGDGEVGGDPASTVPLIARLARSDAGGVPLATEAAAIRAAAGAGVPVPAVEAVGADETLAASFLLMRRLDGEAIPRRLLREDRFAGVRDTLAFRLGEIAARVGQAPADSVPDLPVVGDPLEDLLGELGRDRLPAPGLALAVRWLREQAPPTRSPCLVHGDFRLGNLLVTPDDVTAVLDWELCRVGNPVEDLGWLCAKVWRFGAEAPVAGVGDRTSLLDGYERVAGWRPTLEELAWWELFGTLKWGLITGVMADRHLSGTEESIELLAIGRREAEQEFDVLLDLGYDTPGGHDGAADAAAGENESASRADPAHRADVFGTPTFDDLADGLRRWLTARATEPGAAGFEARVAANVTEVLRREHARGDRARRDHERRLQELGCAEDAELSSRILDGGLDHRWPEVVDAVRHSVRDRVLVANPRHLAQPAAEPATGPAFPWSPG